MFVLYFGFVFSSLIIRVFFFFFFFFFFVFVFVLLLLSFFFCFFHYFFPYIYLFCMCIVFFRSVFLSRSQILLPLFSGCIVVTGISCPLTDNACCHL